MTDATRAALQARGDGFDDAAYSHGRASFDAGVSLRECAEMIALDPAGSATEAKTMSFAIGYADAALDCLRTALKQEAREP